MTNFDTTVTSLGGISAYTGQSPVAQDVESASKAFEQLFVAQMLSHMFSGIKAEGPFSGGFGEEMYRGLMLEEYGRVLTENGGLGIASAIKAQMLAQKDI